MKTQLIFILLFTITFFNANSQSISISKKNSGDPTDVCNNSTYSYVTSISGWQTGYTVAWVKTNGNILSQSTSEAEVKWISNSESDGYIGTIQAEIKNGNGSVIAASDKITVTIKSIKHLKPEISPYFGAGTLTISPCQGGQISLEVPRLIVPGTGTLNPEKVNVYEWYIPSGWQMNGQTSNGSTPIPGDYSITVYYPASATEGTIKVRGYHSVSGCEDGIQLSKYSDIVTVKREVEWVLTSNKSSFYVVIQILLHLQWLPKKHRMMYPVQYITGITEQHLQLQTLFRLYLVFLMLL